MVGNRSSKAPVSFGKLLGTFRFGWATAGCSTFLLPGRAALTHAEIERISSALNVVTTSSPLFRAEGLLASEAVADVDSITNDNAWAFTNSSGAVHHSGGEACWVSSDGDW